MADIDRPADRLQRGLRTAFVVVVLLAALYVVWSAGDFRRAARLFPQYAGAITAILCVLELLRQVWRRRHPAPEALNTADIGLSEDERGLDGMRRGLGIYVWCLGYGGLIVTLGMVWATVVFVPALLHLRFRSDWRITAGLVVGLVALMWALTRLLAVRLPQGWLTPWLPALF
ncbi:MAG: tripartite tricarboxylate transporter TctB family protein [Alkalilacustris sp.]